MACSNALFYEFQKYILVAGFIILDGIRMLCEKMSTLILHFNYCIYIILLLEINKSIIIALKIMNLNILLLNFLKCIVGEYTDYKHTACKNDTFM